MIITPKYLNKYLKTFLHEIYVHLVAKLRIKLGVTTRGSRCCCMTKKCSFLIAWSLTMCDWPIIHSSAYSVTFVSANPSFRSANCPYLSVRPVRFGVAVDPPIGSIGPSINLCSSIPCHPPRTECVRAYLFNLSANLSNLFPSLFSLSLSLSPSPPLSLSFSRSLLSIYLFIYLPFRNRLLFSRLDLTRRLDRPTERPIARPFNSFSTPESPTRIPGIPRDVWFSRADVAPWDPEGDSRALAANGTQPSKSG